jgi:hypothetical protein
MRFDKYYNRGYNEIQKDLDAAYEREAPQEEIDALETELANFVSEEDMISDGISVEEELRNMYIRYIDPTQRHGMTLEDIIANMREVVISNGGRKNITDEELLDASKDAYEHYNYILTKRKVNKNA